MAYVKRAKIGACLPDNVNTDLIFPARYLVLFKPEEIRTHLFEDINPSLAKDLQNRAVLGGANFGCGSAREQGLSALKYAGVQLVIAKSFSRAFFRNGFNNAVPLFIADCPEPIEEIASVGDEVEADFESERESLVQEAKNLAGLRLNENDVVVEENGLGFPGL